MEDFFFLHLRHSQRSLAVFIVTVVRVLCVLGWRDEWHLLFPSGSVTMLVMQNIQHFHVFQMANGHSVKTPIRRYEMHNQCQFQSDMIHALGHGSGFVSTPSNGSFLISF